MPFPRASTLLLFTASYPYDAALEDTFLAPELPHLRDAFERVIVIPTVLEGSRAQVPTGIEVDETFGLFLTAHSSRFELAFRAAFSRLTRDDIAARPGLIRQRRAMARLAVTAGKAEIARSWIRSLFERRALTPGACVAYTFWCDATTTGLSLVRAASPDLVVVSRAHGADLYAERYDPPYLPCRPFTLRNLDRFLPDSERGALHTAHRYPWVAARCEVARMGVVDPGFVTPRSDEGRFVLVSCSRIVPIKRVDLIVRAMAFAAERRPDVEFEWHHFGDGPLRGEIEELARTVLGSNATAYLPGYSSVEDLFAFYRSHPVDAFMNASKSEGTPVAIMEAISCGIPVIATAVGGNPEIVSDRNGFLIDGDPTPADLGRPIECLLEEPDAAAAKRDGSRRTWEAKYDATANYRQFAHMLTGLRGSR